MSPFIVTTARPPAAPDHSHSGNVITRVAVATLEEARPAALLGPSNDGTLTNAAYIAFREQVMALDESGGTVGPLPDGTVIKVEPVLWNGAELGEFSECSYFSPDRTDEQIIAAYNAKQVAA